jgi:hypothetical protein
VSGDKQNEHAHGLGGKITAPQDAEEQCLWREWRQRRFGCRREAMTHARWETPKVIWPRPQFGLSAITGIACFRLDGQMVCPHQEGGHTRKGVSRSRFESPA